MTILNPVTSMFNNPVSGNRSLLSRKDVEMNKRLSQKLNAIANSEEALESVKKETAEMLDKGYDYKTGGLFAGNGTSFRSNKETATDFGYSFSKEPGLRMKNFGR